MGKASRSKQQQKQITISKDRNLFPWIITGISILAVAALVAIVVFMNQITQPGEQATTTPAGVTNDGFVITANGLDTTITPQPVETTFETSEYTADTNNISMYIDYSCPHCFEFEEANFSQIKTWLNDGTIDNLTIHPMAFLGQYSQDAANALTCVAENAPENIIETHETLMENYASALSKQGIIDALEKAGVPTNETLTNCIRQSKYDTFIQNATERAQQGPIPASNIEKVQGTPTVLVNGERYTADPTSPEQFSAFVTSKVAPQQETTTE